MNLLSMLTNMMGGSGVTSTLSENTNLSSGMIGKLLMLALPLLLKKLTSNASTPEGARSLYDALGQHVTDSSLEDQLKEADTEDGAKIIGHILGDSAESDISSLAAQTGLSESDVSGVLNNIAPSLLSNLSSVVTNGLPEADESAVSEAAEEKEEGLGSGIFGFLTNLIAGGGESENTGAFDGTDLLNALSALKD